MPRKLEKYLPGMPAEERGELFGSIMQVMMYPFGDPVRDGIILGTSLSFSCPLMLNRKPSQPTTTL